MIKRWKQIITLAYNNPEHRGVDLRCVRFPGEPGNVPNWRNQPVIAPEKCVIIRQGKDVYKNNFIIVEPLTSNIFGYTEIKFIHLDETNFKFGHIFEEGDVIGKCIIGGNSKSLHLHFETWQGDRPKDPVDYFDVMRIPYGFK